MLASIFKPTPCHRRLFSLSLLPPISIRVQAVIHNLYYDHLLGLNIVIINSFPNILYIFVLVFLEMQMQREFLMLSVLNSDFDLMMVLTVILEGIAPF